MVSFKNLLITLEPSVLFLKTLKTQESFNYTFNLCTEQ
jgi:hypothetical protein